ncbi:hypothetical protein CR513_01812, partial [Mucuna pruriens]
MNELEAARAHNLITIKIWEKFAYTNFPLVELISSYNYTMNGRRVAIRRKSHKCIV